MCILIARSVRVGFLQDRGPDGSSGGVANIHHPFGGNPPRRALRSNTDRAATRILAGAMAPRTRQLPDGTQLITLTVQRGGYSPAAVQALPGVPTRLDLVTDETGGCTRAFVVASKGIQEILPETGVTSVDLGTPRAGTSKYTCGMGMYTGRVAFQAAPIPGGAA